MKRIVLSIAVIMTLVLGGAFATTAKADGRGHGHHGHHGHHGGHYDGGHHHGHYQHYSRPSYGVYCAPAPYTSGYYSTYPGYYSTSPGYYYSRPQPQPRIGFYFGF